MPTNSYKINPKATKSIHYTLYYGTFIHTPDLTTLEINFNTLVELMNKVQLILFIKIMMHRFIIINLLYNSLLIKENTTTVNHIRKIMANNDINILNLLIIPMI